MGMREVLTIPGGPEGSYLRLSVYETRGVESWAGGVRVQMYDGDSEYADIWFEDGQMAEVRDALNLIGVRRG